VTAGVLLGYMLLQLALYIDFSVTYCPAPDPYTPGGVSNGSAVLVLLLIPLVGMLCLFLRKMLPLLSWAALGLVAGGTGWLLFLQSERVLRGVCTTAFPG
jgi:hypothetical protein